MPPQVVDIPVDAMIKAADVEATGNTTVFFDATSRTISVRLANVAEAARIHFRLVLTSSEGIRAVMVPTPVLVIAPATFMMDETGFSLDDWQSAVQTAISIFHTLEEAVRGLRADEDDF